MVATTRRRSREDDGAVERNHDDEACNEKSQYDGGKEQQGSENKDVDTQHFADVETQHFADESALDANDVAVPEISQDTNGMDAATAGVTLEQNMDDVIGERTDELTLEQKEAMEVFEEWRREAATLATKSGFKQIKMVTANQLKNENHPLALFIKEGMGFGDDLRGQQATQMWFCVKTQVRNALQNHATSVTQALKHSFRSKSFVRSENRLQLWLCPFVTNISYFCL